jgi:hypothetical protein
VASSLGNLPPQLLLDIEMEVESSFPRSFPHDSTLIISKGPSN